MPRPPRTFVPGALYHVYNRISSGEAVFSEKANAEKLIELMREAKETGGWTIFAWCLMANHYHLVLRTSEVPLWRGLHRVQNGFSRWFNPRRGRTGPLWQGRYRAKMVAQERYLDQVILYVHLNPVRAGLTGDPGEYPWSGHRELAGRTDLGLLDREQMLLCFGEKKRSALRRYRAAVAAALDAPEGTREGEAIDRGVRDEELWLPRDGVYVDALGRSTAPERPATAAADFLAAACAVLGIDRERLASGRRDRETVAARRLVTALAVERWGIRSGEMARELGRIVEVVSRWSGDGIRLRVTDPSFREAYERLDRDLLGRFASGGGRGASAGTEQC